MHCTFGRTKRDSIFWRQRQTPCIFLRLSLPSVISFLLITDWIQGYYYGERDQVFRFSRYFSIFSSGNLSRLTPLFIFSEKLFFLLSCLLEMLGLIVGLAFRSNLKRRYLCQLSRSNYRLTTLRLVSRERAFLEVDLEVWSEFCDCRSQTISSFLARRGSKVVSSSGSQSEGGRGKRQWRLCSDLRYLRLISIMVLDLIFSSLRFSSAVLLQLLIIFISRLCRWTRSRSYWLWRQLSMQQLQKTQITFINHPPALTQGIYLTLSSLATYSLILYQ